MTDMKSFARGLASPSRLKGVIKYRLAKLICDQRIHLLTNKLCELSVANMPSLYQSPITTDRLSFLVKSCLLLVK